MRPARSAKAHPTVLGLGAAHVDVSMRTPLWFTSGGKTSICMCRHSLMKSWILSVFANSLESDAAMNSTG